MPTTLALPRPAVHVPLFGAFAPDAPAFDVPHAPKHPEQLDTLVCSRPAHQIAAWTPAMSSVVHLFAISGAIMLSQVSPVVQRMVVDTTMIMMLRPAAVAEKVDPAVEKLREERQAKILVVANPPPVGFQTVHALAEIPKDIPPVDLNAKAFDPKDFSGRGVEGGIAAGVVGGTGKVVDLTATHVKGGDAAAAPTRVFTTAEVADPAQIVSQPTPDYPRVFADAGIGGFAVLQFVVDTLGGVEPGSVKVLESSHDPFAAAAMKAIKASRFNPGRMHGEPIRQLVQQRVRFEAPERAGL
ncbi:MAG TPA: TonB family protein [Gemmatimonadales bacterium]|nr:TonB family protein [Gemmatimonadales bacterium]